MPLIFFFFFFFLFIFFLHGHFYVISSFCMWRGVRALWSPYDLFLFLFYYVSSYLQGQEDSRVLTAT